MKLAEELGRSRDEVTSHQKVSGPGVGVPSSAMLMSGAARRQLRDKPRVVGSFQMGCHGTCVVCFLVLKHAALGVRVGVSWQVL